MVCVSLAEPTVGACLRALAGVKFAEIRLDKMRVGVSGVKKIFAGHCRLIATCRPGRISEEKRRRLLVAAVEAGAAFVDIELVASAKTGEAVVRAARASGCRVIVSFHDFKRTPPREDLEKAVAHSFERGADIAKIACMVRSPRDNARLLGLLDDGRPLIVVGMGGRGRITRIAAPLLGGVLSYAAKDGGRETARGQVPAAPLERILSELRDETSV
jgi:3-dehydroquinate dehydratase type I